jgi:ribonucleoside-diphosphate reductase beta chain
MSTTEETIRKVEETELDGLKDLDIEDVYTHIEVLLQERPGPLDLYRRWEQQQWSASALDFSTDKEHWEGFFTPFLREQLQNIFSGFFVGEYAVTDTLSPLVAGAPDEETKLFLSTQVVDEARHTYFFARFFNEVIGIQGTLSEAIEYAKEWTNTGPYRQIFEGDLVAMTDAVRLDPTDYSKWIKGITIYHLMVEGILALVGQKLILRILRNLDLLPAFRAGFTAVTRDESRHVNFGVRALQQGIKDGHEQAITETVDLSLENCFRIYANPERKIIIPDDVPPQVRQDPRVNWSFGIDSLTKRLRVAGVDSGYVKGVEQRAWEVVWSAIDEYEARHGEEHPVRGWERGETQALIEASS